jgi:amino acid adenylation domain-containing protein
MARTLAQILIESARRYPDNVALDFDGEAVTYSALDELSNRLANALARRGVRRGDRVGLYLGKSIQSVAGLFAILKADAVCVPLDPTGPIQRIRYIIEDCGVSCLISHPEKARALGEVLAGETPIRRLVLAGEPGETGEIAGVPATGWGEVLAESAAPPPHRSLDIDLAYILYTSGSTGTPKGVMISNLNALSFVDWASEFFGITEADRLSCHAPLHFDLTIFDVYVALKCGAAVCLVPPEINVMPVDLARFISTRGITVWQSVPSVLVLLVNQGNLPRWTFDRLRLVLFAGEVFPVKDLRELMAKIPGAQYYNIYGATEINDVTWYHIAEPPTAPIPIGKPCSNVELFAIDDEGRRVEGPGVKGELYVRGLNVTQGYWGNPEMTAERYVQNPLHSLYHDVVYRTGDLVELDADGNYRYAGRRDSQVKVRGYRVSLNEVEDALMRHPEVEQAAVVVLQDESEANFLKAFLVPKGGAEISLKGLRNHCLGFIPRYMLPEEVEQCPSLPMTSTGKVDKQKLRAARTLAALEG